MDINKLFNFREGLPYITLIVFLFSTIALSLFWVIPQVCIHLPVCSSINLDIPEPIRSSMLLLGIAFFVIVFMKSKDSLEHRIKRGRSKYIFNHRSWPKGWVFNGRPEVIDENLHVKSSRAGLLLENRLWKNFRMTFEMKFDRSLYSEEHVGVVFRARDLDNYFMLEIRGGDVPGIAPHIRFKSGWESAGVKRFNEFDFTDFRKIVVEAIEDIATLSYEGHKIFYWILPTHADISHFEFGVDDKKVKEESAMLSRTPSGNHVQEIPFRLDYGMVGFRAHYHEQGAIVRNLEVESI